MLLAKRGWENVVMRKACAVAAAALLVLVTTVCQAEEKVQPPPIGEASAPVEMTPCKTACKSCGHPLWGWLTYHPSSHWCDTCLIRLPCCNPPLFAYFLDSCAARPTSCYPPMPIANAHVSAVAPSPSDTALVTWEVPAEAPKSSQSKPEQSNPDKNTSCTGGTCTPAPRNGLKSHLELMLSK